MDFYKALVAAQGKIKNPAFDRNNTHFNSKYATLQAHIDALRPILHAQGIAIVQKVGSTDDGRLTLTTALVHESGAREESTVAVPLPENPQKVMALLTYLRRGMLAAICCVAGDEDDDGDAVVPEKPAAKEIPPAELERRLEAVRARQGVESAISGKRGGADQRIEGVVKKVYENTTKTGKVVWKIQLEDGPRLTAWADGGPDCSKLILGNRYAFSGKVKDDPQYGQEFTVKAFDAMAPAGVGEDIPF